MPFFTVETVTVGFTRQARTQPTVDEAEALARRLSASSIHDPTHPNPFFVLDSDGSLLCQYVGGERRSAIREHP
jgi:hypothetical protein